jgi:hypothetical protein
MLRHVPCQRCGNPIEANFTTDTELEEWLEDSNLCTCYQYQSEKLRRRMSATHILAQNRLLARRRPLVELAVPVDQLIPRSGEGCQFLRVVGFSKWPSVATSCHRQSPPGLAFSISCDNSPIFRMALNRISANFRSPSEWIGRLLYWGSFAFGLPKHWSRFCPGNLVVSKG